MKCGLRNIFFFFTFALVSRNSTAQNKKTIPQPADTTRPMAVVMTSFPRSGPRPYKELITDKALTRKGLLRVHKVDEKWYFEIADSLLKRDILLVNRIAKAPANTRAGFFGYAGDEINQNVIRFEKGPNNKLFLRTVSYAVYSRDSTGPMYKSVQNSNIQPITAAFDIRAFSPDSTASVIDVTDWLSGDNDVFFFSSSYKSSLRLGGLQNDKSYIQDIRTYPMNTEIRTVKTYSRISGLMPAAISASASGGYSTFELNSSMVTLPERQMVPRYFDDRVAYHTTEYTDFDADPRGVKNVSLITRWRLEPKDTAKYNRGELVEPVKPIIYYIDPSTPKKWVPYLIQGVNDWQRAFEKAGFKNAIMGKLAPTPQEDSTWSIEDARYNAIVYKASEVFNAQGAHIQDPRSGEILESHINWFHNLTMLLQRWYTLQAGNSDPRTHHPILNDTLMGQLIRFVSSHEVGHTLGLPHNMGASSATPVEKLRDKKWLELHGHTASIMDYARFNYVAQPEDSVSFSGLMPRIGDYDEWAIEWGYRYFPGKPMEEEKQVLNNWVKSKAGNKRLRFLYDNVNDPRAQTEDLGDNAIKAGGYGITNLKRILPQLPEWFTEPGETHDLLEKMYDEGVAQYSRFIGHALTNIGGVYTDLKTTDQPGVVFTIVPRAKQKEALAFIQTHLFETPYWLLEKKILSLTSAPNDRISSIQDTYLSSMLSNNRLSRMISARNSNRKAYGVDEYMEDIQKALWNELPSHRPIDNYRRNLQKGFIEKLSGIVNPAATASSGFTISFGPVFDLRKSDIVSVAKAILHSLRTDIKKALPGYQDKMSRYHLQDVLERIDKVFKKD